MLARLSLRSRARVPPQGVTPIGHEYGDGTNSYSPNRRSLAAGGSCLWRPISVAASAHWGVALKAGVDWVVCFERQMPWLLEGTGNNALQLNAW